MVCLAWPAVSAMHLLLSSHHLFPLFLKMSSANSRCEHFARNPSETFPKMSDKMCDCKGAKNAGNEILKNVEVVSTMLILLDYHEADICQVGERLYIPTNCIRKQMHTTVINSPFARKSIRTDVYTNVAIVISLIDSDVSIWKYKEPCSLEDLDTCAPSSAQTFYARQTSESGYGLVVSGTNTHPTGTGTSTCLGHRGT